MFNNAQAYLILKQTPTTMTSFSPSMYVLTANVTTIDPNIRASSV